MLGEQEGHLADGALAEVGFQDAYPALLVGQGDVDELVQAAGSQNGGVDDVWSVCGANDEDVLLTGHSIHLGQDLVDDTVGRSAAVSHVAATGFGYGVQLIEEENAGRRLASLEARENKMKPFTNGGAKTPSLNAMFLPCQRSL